MITGTRTEARWARPGPRRELTRAQLKVILRAAALSTRVQHVEALADGLRNANFKVQLDACPEPVVIRVYEHDDSLCQKEIDLNGLIGGAVPVPEIVYAQPSRSDELPPFAIFRFVEGPSFRELKRRGDREAIAQAACSAGETLARISQFEFAVPGWLGPGPEVVPEPRPKPDLIPKFVDSCLAADTVQRRMDPSLRRRVQAIFWHWAPQLQTMSGEVHLVHGDFGKRNLLVQTRAGKWTVAAVLDWEFACSGSALADVGEFLRYEHTTSSSVEPHFSKGFTSQGGKLPFGWRKLARIIDLAKLCDSLTRDFLPEALVPEIGSLIRAAVDALEGHTARCLGNGELKGLNF